MNNDKLTPEDIRHFILDRTALDNELELDLYFTDDEIFKAIRHACMSFNSIPPRVYFLEPLNAPYTMTMLHGTAYHLYLSKIDSLGRNEIEYTSGGVTSNSAAARIRNLKELAMLHRQEFETLARQEKIEQNIMSGFSTFC